MLTTKKKHYLILDGLRGVAALLVLIFHLFELYLSPNIQIVSHGYLAVDFFFLLSGFVIAHAYDDRWAKMSLKDFCKRRLIRLHPMIFVGTTLGLALYFFQVSPLFPTLGEAGASKLAVVFILGCLLIPVPPQLDVRGWSEMYPLNGAAWTLFFEYVANILYALFIRKWSNKVLIIAVILAGAFLARFAIVNGDVIGGWSLTFTQVQVGLTRLLYPFLAGMLLRRLFKPISLKKHAFLICSLLLIGLLSVPKLGIMTTKWINGSYEALTILILFPLIIWVGASGEIKEGVGKRCCKFLGDISYPLYITHYPFVCIFMAYFRKNELTITQSLPYAALTFVVCITVAYLSLKLYDTPVRKILNRHFNS